MSGYIAIEALKMYFSADVPKRHIRLFGGEPLMRFDLVRSIVDFCKQQASGPQVTFDITTNGLQFSDRMFDFFRGNPQVEVIISLDGDRTSQTLNRISRKGKLDSYSAIWRKRDNFLKLPKLTVNMVIAPNQVDDFFWNFIHIVEMGFRRLNFLPAYFVRWRESELIMLKKRFREIISFIAKHDIGLYIKNLEVNANTALFNDGLIVDCNGDIFTNNVVLSKHFSHLRQRLVLGNVRDSCRRVIFEYKPEDINHLIRGNIDNGLWESTRSVDRILTGFVSAL